MRMQYLIMGFFLILVISFTKAQQTLFLNGNATNPEIFIDYGPTGYVYVEGGISAVNNGGATGTPDVVVNGGLFIYMQGAAVGTEGDIINNTGATFIFDYTRAAAPTTTDLTGTLPTIVANSPGVTAGLGGTVHLMTGTQELSSSTTKDFTFYNLSLEGSGNTQKNITTNGITVNVGVGTGVAGNTGKLYLGDEYFNTNASNVWIKNTATTAIERDPLGDGTTGTTGMLMTDQNPAATYGMVTSTGQGRLRWTTASGSSYLFPVGSDDMTLYRPVGILSADATTYSVRLNKGNANRWVMGTAAPNSTSATYYALINAEATTTTNDQFRLYGVYNDLMNVTGSNCTLADVLPDIGAAQNEQTTAKNWGFQPGTSTAPLTSGNLFYTSSTSFPFSGALSGCSQTVNTTRTNYQAWNGFAGAHIQNEAFTLASRPDYCLQQSNGCTGLPVELINFWGEEIGAENLLHWKTATEINTQWHVVERSADGLTAFSEIGRKPAAGNSNVILNYNLTDEQPLLNSYYRLKTIDLDGSYSYSPVILLSRKQTDNNEITSIVNNNNTIILQYHSTDNSEVSIRLFTDIGQQIFQNNFNTESGNNTFTLNTNSLARAVYIVQVKQNNQVLTKKFIVR